MNITADSINLPYLTDEEIWQFVENFRSEHIGNIEIPINIEYIIEHDLNVSIIPTPNIEYECSMFALLQSDLSAIRVDEQIYLDDRYLFKYRSDLSHEVGHFYMHKDIYEGQSFDSVAEWMNFIDGIHPQVHSRFEYQAYEFAGRLLVPRQILLEDIENQKDSIIQLKKMNPKITPNELAPYLVNNINTKFQVSSSFLEKRIIKERILEKFLC